MGETAAGLWYWRCVDLSALLSWDIVSEVTGTPQLHKSCTLVCMHMCKMC